MFQWDRFLLKAVRENRRRCLFYFRCLATFFLPPLASRCIFQSVLPYSPGVLVLCLPCPVAVQLNLAYPHSALQQESPCFQIKPYSQAILSRGCFLHGKFIYKGKPISDANRLAQLPWYLQTGKANTMWLEFGQGPGPTSQKEVWRPNCQWGFGKTLGDPEHTMYLRHFA